MKRFAATLLAVVLLSLTGCQKYPRLSADSPVTVVLWNYYIGEQKKAFDSMVDDFNHTVGQERGIILQSVSKADVQALNEQISAALNSEPGSEPLPDVFFAYADIAYQLAQQELLVDYTEYMEDDQLEEYVPGFLDEGRLYGDSRIYILPAAKSTEVLVVNRTHFDRFCEAAAGAGGYPEVSIGAFATWEGIARAAEVYYSWSAENDPSAQGGGRALFGVDSLANYLFSSHKQLGHDLIYAEDGAGVVDFGTGVLERVWSAFYVPTVKGQFASYGRFRSDDLRTGDILAFLGSSSAVAYVGNEVVDDEGSTSIVEIEILPMPVFEGAQPVAIQQGAGMAVTKSTPEKEYAATIFAHWFTEPERNIEFATQSAYLPVRSEAVGQLTGEYAGASGATSAVEQMLATALGQIDSGYLMYTPPAFDTAYNARSMLESELRNALDSARADLLQEVAAGEDYDSAMERHISGQAVQAYMDACERGLAQYDIEIRR